MDANAICDAVFEVGACAEKRRQILDAKSKKCGSCYHWMKSSCVPEKQHGQFKSMSSPGCGAFEQSQWVAEFIQKLEGELQDLIASREAAEAAGGDAMKRYRLLQGKLRPDPNGEWVRVTDHDDEVERLKDNQIPDRPLSEDQNETWDRIERCEYNGEPLSLAEQREMAAWWRENHEAMMELDDKTSRQESEVEQLRIIRDYVVSGIPYTTLPDIVVTALDETEAAEAAGGDDGKL